MGVSACQGCGTIIVSESRQGRLPGSSPQPCNLQVRSAGERRLHPTGSAPALILPPAELPAPGLHPPACGLTPFSNQTATQGSRSAFVFETRPPGPASRAHLRCHQTAPAAPSPSTSPAPSRGIRSRGYTDPGGAGKGWSAVRGRTAALPLWNPGHGSFPVGGGRRVRLKPPRARRLRPTRAGPGAPAVGRVPQHAEHRVALVLLAAPADEGARVPGAQQQLQPPDSRVVQGPQAAGKGLDRRHGGGPARGDPQDPAAAFGQALAGREAGRPDPADGMGDPYAGEIDPVPGTAVQGN